MTNDTGQYSIWIVFLNHTEKQDSEVLTDISDLTGYMNSDLLISYKSKIDEIKSMANVQNESFKTIAERVVEWKREMDHFPGISPVSVKFRLGDGFKFRDNSSCTWVQPVCITDRILKFLMEQKYMLPVMVQLLNQDGTQADSEIVL